MARDLPSDRPKFDRARDTPGRDAYAMRVAARTKTKNMFPPGTSDLKASVAHKIRNKEYVTPAERVALAKEGAFAPRGPLGKGIQKAIEFSGVPKLVDDAVWSVTHPRDRIMGRGRAKEQTMMMPVLGRPVWRMPTRNPDWEIIRNKKYDVVVGMMGRKQKLYGSHRFGTAQVSRARQVLRNLERRGAAPGPPATNPADQAAYYQAAINQARRDVEMAMVERRKAGVDWDFSAVPTGTRQPHASISMQVSPDETYVDFLGSLTKTMHGEGDPRNLLPYTGATYDPLEVPPSVLGQLMMQALIPRRNIKAFVINDELEKFIFRMQRKGMFEKMGIPNIGFTQENPWQSGTMR